MELKRSIHNLLGLVLLIACAGCANATPESSEASDALEDGPPFAGQFDVAGESRAIADAIAFLESDQGYDELVVVFYDRAFDREALRADGQVSRWDFTGMPGAYLMLSIAREEGVLRGYGVLSAQDPPHWEGTTDEYDDLSGALTGFRLDGDGAAGSFSYGAHTAHFDLSIER